MPPVYPALGVAASAPTISQSEHETYEHWRDDTDRDDDCPSIGVAIVRQEKCNANHRRSLCGGHAAPSHVPEVAEPTTWVWHGLRRLAKRCAKPSEGDIRKRSRTAADRP